MCGHYFDITDANVVCRELGYPEATRYYTYNYYGPGSGPIWLANLACNGSETSLHYCSHGGIGNTYYYCSHYHDIGVVCKGIILILYVHIHVYYTLPVCNDLPIPANGGIFVTGTGVGDTATYYCDYGYDLIGDGTATCQASGNWSGLPPTCIS